MLNDKPYFNEAGFDEQIGRVEGEKNSVTYNENAFLQSCKSMLYILRRPPKVIYVYTSKLVILPSSLHLNDTFNALLLGYCKCSILKHSCRSTSLADRLIFSMPARHIWRVLKSGMLTNVEKIPVPAAKAVPLGLRSCLPNFFQCSCQCSPKEGSVALSLCSYNYKSSLAGKGEELVRSK